MQFRRACETHGLRTTFLSLKVPLPSFLPSFVLWRRLPQSPSFRWECDEMRCTVQPVEYLSGVRGNPAATPAEYLRGRFSRGYGSLKNARNKLPLVISRSNVRGVGSLLEMGKPAVTCEKQQTKWGINHSASPFTNQTLFLIWWEDLRRSISESSTTTHSAGRHVSFLLCARKTHLPS